MRILSRLPWLLLPLSLACAPKSPGQAVVALPDGPGVLPIDEEAWRAELLEERAQKDEEYATSETSPMAGTQYLTGPPHLQVFLRDNKAIAGLTQDRQALFGVGRER